MAEGLSQRAYGRSRKARGLPGGSQEAVRKAIETERIHTLPDGSIDPATADRDWEANTSDSMRRQDPAVPAPVAAIAPVDAPELFAEPSKADIEKEVLVEKRDKLRRENLAREGELIPAAEVQGEVGELISDTQNRFLLLPARLRDRLAASSDPDEVQSILDRELRKAMEEQSQYRVKAGSGASIAALILALASLWRPPSEVPVSQWAEQHRYLSSSVAAEGGSRWQSFAFQREPMDAVSDPSIRRVVLKSATQLLKSSTIENATAYTMVESPGPIMIVLPRKEDAREFSEDRIAPMIEDTPVLSRIAKLTRAGLAPKRYRGGRLTITSAGSPANLAKRAVKLLCWDEADLMPVTVGDAGGPVGLGRQRLASYRHRGKEIIASSPTIEKSLIDREYALSDQREFYLPCPHCGHRQSLMKRWERVRWEETRVGEQGEPIPLTRQQQADSARYYCVGCEKPWDNAMRLAAVENGEWRAHAPFNGIAGFWISELYSPFKSLSQIVMTYLEAQGSVEDEKRFTNTSLAENWVGKADRPQYDLLLKQREEYPVGAVPRGGLLLTAGADVHPDRIEVEVVAWGRRKQRWSVAYEIFEGNTAELVGAKSPSPWEKLSALLGELYPHEGGGDLGITALFVDASNQTNDVYQWARLHQNDTSRLPWGPAVPKVRAIMGRDRAKQPICQPTAVDVTQFGRTIKHGLRIQIVNVSFFKERLYSHLKLTGPTDEAVLDGALYPEGYCHFPKGIHYGDEHFKQLCAEEFKTVYDKRGFPIRQEWQKIRVRNEALDCAVYGDACGYQVGIERFQERHWSVLEAALGPQQQNFELTHPVQTSAKPPENATTPIPRVHAGVLAPPRVFRASRSRYL